MRNKIKRENLSKIISNLASGIAHIFSIIEANEIQIFSSFKEYILEERLHQEITKNIINEINQKIDAQFDFNNMIII